MQVCVGNLPGANDRSLPLFSKEQTTRANHKANVATVALSEQHTIATRTERGYGAASTANPSLTCEALQLERRLIRQQHHVTSAVEHETQPYASESIRGVSDWISIIDPEVIIRV